MCIRCAHCTMLYLQGLQCERKRIVHSAQSYKPGAHRHDAVCTPSERSKLQCAHAVCCTLLQLPCPLLYTAECTAAHYTAVLYCVHCCALLNALLRIAVCTLVFAYVPCIVQFCNSLHNFAVLQALLHAARNLLSLHTQSVLRAVCCTQSSVHCTHTLLCAVFKCSLLCTPHTHYCTLRTQFVHTVCASVCSSTYSYSRSRCRCWSRRAHEPSARDDRCASYGAWAPPHRH